MNKRPLRFTDSQVGHILKRAAEIDARGDSLDADELRAIAAEAGIDPEATDAAIRELLAEEEGAPVPWPEPGSSVAENDPRVPARKAGLPLPWRIAAGGAVGAACGFMIGLAASGFVFVPGTAVIGAGTTILYLATRAALNMKRGDQPGFQIENLAVWLGIALVAMPVLGPFFVQPLLVAWFLAAVVGGFLVRFGSKDEGDTDEPPRIGAGAG